MWSFDFAESKVLIFSTLYEKKTGIIHRKRFKWHEIGNSIKIIIVPHVYSTVPLLLFTLRHTRSCAKMDLTINFIDLTIQITSEFHIRLIFTFTCLKQFFQHYFCVDKWKRSRDIACRMTQLLYLNMNWNGTRCLYEVGISFQGLYALLAINCSSKLLTNDRPSTFVCISPTWCDHDDAYILVKFSHCEL